MCGNHQLSIYPNNTNDSVWIKYEYEENKMHRMHSQTHGYGRFVLAIHLFISSTNYSIVFIYVTKIGDFNSFIYSKIERRAIQIVSLSPSNANKMGIFMYAYHTLHIHTVCICIWHSGGGKKWQRRRWRLNRLHLCKDVGSQNGYTHIFMCSSVLCTLTETMPTNYSNIMIFIR